MVSFNGLGRPAVNRAMQQSVQVNTNTQKTDEQEDTKRHNGWGGKLKPGDVVITSYGTFRITSVDNKGTVKFTVDNHDGN